MIQQIALTGYGSLLVAACLVLMAAIFLLGWLHYRKIKEARKLKSEIRRLMTVEKKLLQAQKKTAHADIGKTRFLSAMSHEIRNPMNTVLGFADILLSQTTDQQQKKYLRAIRASSKTLLTLINDVLDLSKLDAGTLKIAYEPTNVRIIFEELENLFSNKFSEKRLQLNLSIAPQLPDNLLLDEIRLRQILTGLMRYTIDTNSNTEININVTCTGIRNGEINLRAEIDEPGSTNFPERQQALTAAFGPDENEAMKTGATGLGLHVAKKLARLMQGDIVQDKSRQGKSVVVLTFNNLKVIHAPRPASRPSAPESGDVHFKKATILIVDDIGQNRFLLREFLKKTGLAILEAADGRQAVDQARRHHPALIIMDIRMPHMDGIEATREIRKTPGIENTRIIALTASAMEEEIRRTISAGFDDYLKKPVKFADLFRLLIRFLPHEIQSKTKPETPPNSGPVVKNFPPEITEKLVPVLEGDLMDNWKMAVKSGFVDEIAKFGNKLIQTGDAHDCRQLINYGSDLIESTESFDVSSMKQILHQYPRIIDELKIKK